MPFHKKHSCIPSFVHAFNYFLEINLSIRSNVSKERTLLKAFDKYCQIDSRGEQPLTCTSMILTTGF